jgi:hypothetical protein
LKILLITVLVTLAGCAGTPVKLYEDPNLDFKKIARITTDCDSQCEEAIEIDGRYQINKGLLLEVDGQVGERKVSEGLAFNNSWNSSLSIEVAEGEHELVMYHNSRLVRAKPERFKVELLAEHTYAIGRARVEHIKNLSYRWFPFVYDTTDRKLVYANDYFFNESATNTCMLRKKNEGYCSCFVGVLDMSLSYNEKEKVIMGGSSSVGLVLDKMTENSGAMSICKLNLKNI